MQDNTEQESNKSMDLGKLKIPDYLIFFQRALNGTEAGYFWKVGAFILSSIAALIFFSYSIGAKSESSTKPEITQSTQSLPQPTIISTVSTPNLTLSNDGKINELNELIRLKNNEIDSLKEKLSALRSELDAKPSNSRCSDYDQDMKSLRNNKMQIELHIQSLLYPTPTKEMLEQGLTYSIQDISRFVRVAEEQRKTASDVQRQIESLDNIRKRCD